MFRSFASLLILCSLLACNRLPEEHVKIVAPFLQQESLWADSLVMQMSTEEKIGQLIFLQAQPSDSLQFEELSRLAGAGKIGGLLLDQLFLHQYTLLTDRLNECARIPLFYGTTQEVALNNQIANAEDLPLPTSIAAIASDSIQRFLNELYLRQCSAIGINFCFSPSLEILNQETADYDPFVFESDPETRIHRSSKRLEALREQRILSIAHSFSDYIELPNDTTNRVDSILHPYYNLVHNGLSGILVADQLYQIDTFDRLQPDFLKTYLEKQLEFDGLLISRLSESATLGKLIHAGTDIFLVDGDVEGITRNLSSYVEEGLLTQRDLNEKVRKVLMAKAWMGLDTLATSTDYARAGRLLLDPGMDYFARQLQQSALTLVSNPDTMLPFRKIHNRQFKLIRPEGPFLRNFMDIFSHYADFRDSRTTKTKDGKWKAVLPKKLQRSTVIVVLDQIELDTSLHGLWIESINELATRTEVAIINYGNPYNLRHFTADLALLQAWEFNPTTESMAAQLLFGGAEAPGRLPMALSVELPFGHSAPLGSIHRLSYDLPQSVGFSPMKLVGIDAVFQSAINMGATPGGQVLVVKNGKVIYDKAFGYQSSDKKQKVSPTDLYDLASITKVAATTLSAMKLYGEKKFKMSEPYGKYVKGEVGKKVSKISFKKLFTHASGLQANMPIAPYITFKDSMNADSNQYFCKVTKGGYTVCIADSVYLDKRWVDTIWQEVLNLKPQRRSRYRYSDVNFNLIQYFLESTTGQPLDQFAKKNFYDPLNLRYTTFNPLQHFEAGHICPSAVDQRWRKQELRGYVHDEAAALFSGVGGNAGLFSNARDLSVLFQMLLNGGEYGDQKLIDPETIDFFTSNRHGNHRGLGFDKPARRRRVVPSYSHQASSKSYGHTGFTGPCVWVDPQHELIYIFIANRVNPDPQNRKLFRQKIRSRIHNIVYDAFDTYKPFTLEDIDEPNRLEEARAEITSR